MVHEVDVVCDHLYHTKRLWITNWETSELFLYTCKLVWRTTFETTWEKFPNLLGMKLRTDVILLFLSSVNNVIFVYFLKSQVWNMELTGSTNAGYTSDRVACTIKVNIKEAFMGNDGFLPLFMWWMDCSQRIKELLLDKCSIKWGNNKFLLLCPPSEKQLDLC